MINSKFLDLMSDEQKTEAKTSLKENQVRDKLAVHFNISITDAENLSKGCTYIMSSTGRIKNIIDKSGEHIASPRLNDGGLSLTSAGAKKIYGTRTNPFQMPSNRTCHGITLEPACLSLLSKMMQNHLLEKDVMYSTDLSKHAILGRLLTNQH